MNEIDHERYPGSIRPAAELDAIYLDGEHYPEISEKSPVDTTPKPILHEEWDPQS